MSGSKAEQQDKWVKLVLFSWIKFCDHFSHKIIFNFGFSEKSINFEIFFYFRLFNLKCGAIDAVFVVSSLLPSLFLPLTGDMLSDFTTLVQDCINCSTTILNYSCWKTKRYWWYCSSYMYFVLCYSNSYFWQCHGIWKLF